MRRTTVLDKMTENERFYRETTEGILRFLPVKPGSTQDFLDTVRIGRYPLPQML